MILEFIYCHNNFTFETEKIEVDSDSDFSFLSWIFGSISFGTCLLIIALCYFVHKYFTTIRNTVSQFTSPINFLVGTTVPQPATNQFKQVADRFYNQCCGLSFYLHQQPTNFY